jgi:FkbM family methyltransferase
MFPKARIVSIEPDKNNLELLRMNTAAFGDRVAIVQGGIWNQHGALRIVNPDSGSAAFRVEFSEKTDLVGIPAYTIDDLCQIGGSPSPFVVKLDIEGAQAHLFASNTDWVGRTTLITLELDDWLLPWQGTSRNFLSCISGYPFDYLLGGESIFCFRDEESH